MKVSDSTYFKAIEFGKQFRKRHHIEGMSNIYVAQLFDLDGNLVDEKYGMNVMTDYGMNKMFTDHATFPTNVYIGSGDGIIGPDSSSMLQQQWSEPAIVTDSTKANYPMFFDSTPVDPELRVITCVSRYCICKFTYSIGGGSLSITEYGIGTSPTQLWTHSFVYDSLGRQSMVNKLQNTELVLTIFLCMSFNEKMITDAWSNGKALLITTMNRFYNEMGFVSTGVNVTNKPYTFKANGSVCERVGTGGSGFGYTTTGFKNENDQRWVQINTNMGEYTITTVNTDNNGGYVDGSVMNP